MRQGFSYSDNALFPINKVSLTNWHSMTSPNTNNSKSEAIDNQLPLDAAVLIIIDMSEKIPKVLMGLRNKNLAFMPGKLVFPGGRVDPGDSTVETPDYISDQEAQRILTRKLEHSILTDPKTLPLTAIRETFEETGVMIGQAGEISPTRPIKAEWAPFAEHSIIPVPSALKYCARAITPPNRVRRYDTRFFCVNAEHIAKEAGFIPGELDEIKWLTVEQALETKLASITRIITSDIQKGLARKNLFDDDFEIPFYYSEDGIFRRDIIT